MAAMEYLSAPPFLKEISKAKFLLLASDKQQAPIFPYKHSDGLSTEKIHVS